RPAATAGRRRSRAPWSAPRARSTRSRRRAPGARYREGAAARRRPPRPPRPRPPLPPAAPISTTIARTPPYHRRLPRGSRGAERPGVPMRVATLTDIHSNLPALESVLAAIDETGIERRWCLGDVVGYGAQPDQCAELVAAQCELSLVGNHDLAVTGEI